MAMEVIQREQYEDNEYKLLQCSECGIQIWQFPESDGTFEHKCGDLSGLITVHEFVYGTKP